MKKIYIRNKGISIISKSGVFVEAESGNVYYPFDYEYKDIFKFQISKCFFKNL